MGGSDSERLARIEATLRAMDQRLAKIERVLFGNGDRIGLVSRFYVLRWVLGAVIGAGTTLLGFLAGRFLG